MAILHRWLDLEARGGVRGLGGEILRLRGEGEGFRGRSGEGDRGDIWGGSVDMVVGEDWQEVLTIDEGTGSGSVDDSMREESGSAFCRRIRNETCA